MKTEQIVEQIERIEKRNIGHERDLETKQKQIRYYLKEIERIKERIEGEKRGIEYIKGVIEDNNYYIGYLKQQ